MELCRSLDEERPNEVHLISMISNPSGQSHDILDFWQFDNLCHNRAVKDRVVKLQNQDKSLVVFFPPFISCGACPNDLVRMMSSKSELWKLHISFKVVLAHLGITYHEMKAENREARLAEIVSLCTKA